MSSRNGDYEVPKLLHALERLFGENPTAVRTFISWIEDPGFSDSVTLHFYQHRLNTVERKQTIK